MSKRKSEKERAKKLKIAMALLAVAVVLGIASISFAHGNSENRGTISHGMTGVQSGSMMQMNAMMGGGTPGSGHMSDGTMGHMAMMRSHHGDMGEEEIKDMIEEMDEDGDGECDFCKMPVEACGRMMGE